MILLPVALVALAILVVVLFGPDDAAPPSGRLVWPCACDWCVK